MPNIKVSVQSARQTTFFRRSYNSNGSSHHGRNLQDNYIKTRVWKSGYYDKDNKFIFAPAPKVITRGKLLGDNYNVGHVSIETKHLYASFWPNGEILGKLDSTPGVLLRAVEVDVRAERRNPDCVVELFTLNTEALESEFRKFTRSKLMWTISGANKWLNKNEAESCSGLAYRLLVSAGIKELVPDIHLIRDVIVATPNNLAELILEAEKSEISKYPGIRNNKNNANKTNDIKKTP